MSHSAHNDLRAQLAAGFNKLTLDLEDAREVDQAVSSLKDTFYDSMRGLIRAWSTRNLISKLPSEILAMCIGFLPLRRRITCPAVETVTDLKFELPEADEESW
ncbi:hypothetical protein AURDEDRAFT_173106 [Auricularia subglabra TFB-10046 SS5]|nr:hypothetical protein AURDEDRAFT_173106 [Auricularia subglabra TFB-10046 SS5]